MTPISEIIFSGFVSKVVNDIGEISKDVIKKAVKHKNEKYQNVESQIYNVIVNVLNKITNNSYRNNQDSIYDASEVFVESLKRSSGDALESIKSCLRVLGLKVNQSECLKFKISLYEQLGKNEYSELFRAILLLLLEQKNQYDYYINEQLMKKLAEVEKNVDKLNQKLDDVQKNNDDTIIQNKLVKFQDNRKQDYIKNWNSRLFLHQNNDERPITLADAFIMPDYQIKKAISRIGFSYKDTLDMIIEKFIRYNKTSTMLITGVPGMGKSSIMSWIANKYENNVNYMFLRFRDFKKKELEKGLLNCICSMLSCEYEDLENIILIMDGFDEMKTLNISSRLLRAFFNDIKDYENLKCIITSRPNYIDSYYFQNYIILQEFNMNKVKKFYNRITGKNLNRKNEIESNLEVLGIPVILYMAIMSNIDIGKNITKPELYNRIFAEEGGIFDRFYDGEVEYSKGAQVLRNPQNIKVYLEFLRESAFAMFQKNSLLIRKENCKIPELEFQGEFVSILDFPIKHLFDDIGNNSIEFIHKSIYEYFVSEYLFKYISQMINTNTSEEELAVVLSKWLLERKNFSDEIYDFLQYKISKKLGNMFRFVNRTFQLMLKNGMTYYTGTCYKNAINCEVKIFANALDFLHLWENKIIELNSGIREFLICSKGMKIDLSRTNLSNFDLSNIDLSEKNLQGAKLIKTNLDRANLQDVNLKGVSMACVSLIYTILDEKQISYFEEKGIKNSLINTRVAILNRNEIINYEDYCKQKKFFKDI